MNIILFEGPDIPEKISINSDSGKHIRKILKLKAGETFSYGMVNGPSGKGRITGADSEWIYFTWEKTSEPEGLYPVVLLIGYTRPISSKRILREAASLGVSEIVFTGTDTGEKSYRDSSLWSGEYRKYLLMGAEQAASTGVPEVSFFPDLGSCLGSGLLERNFDRIVLDNIAPDFSLSGYNPELSGTLLAVGSERGWSDRERALFRSEGFSAVSLGKRVLRTETASTAGISLLLSRMGLI